MTSDLLSRLLRGESMSPSAEFISSLLSEMSDCPNCQWLTFDATWDPFENLRRRSYDNAVEYRSSSAPKRFGITGQLCAEHWLTLSVTASSSETSPPSPSLPPCDDDGLSSWTAPGSEPSSTAPAGTAYTLTGHSPRPEA
jgi:hypothetical protein